MSTTWLAARCGSLHSIEDDVNWYKKVKSLLAKRRVHNVRYELRATSSYPDLSEYPDGFFNFAVIDGAARADCVRSTLPKIAPGGWIYLDNTDLGAHENPNGDVQQAEQALLGAVAQRNGTARYFVDFAPTSFVVYQGMLARL
jgi:predicted O-methyltransferase YrrM